MSVQLEQDKVYESIKEAMGIILKNVPNKNEAKISITYKDEEVSFKLSYPKMIKDLS